MAIKLADKTNVTAPDSDYPYGRIKDNPGNGTGTPVNVQVYGDFHQFFARLLDKAGIKANGLPDNDYSGFQYFQALEDRIRQLIEGTSISPTWHTIPLINGWVSHASSPVVASYMIDQFGKVHLRGALDSTGASSAVITAAGAIPLPKTASTGMLVKTPIVDSTDVISILYLSTSGNSIVSFTVGRTYYLDGISWSTDHPIA